MLLSDYPIYAEWLHKTLQEGVQIIEQKKEEEFIFFKARKRKEKREEEKGMGKKRKERMIE